MNLSEPAERSIILVTLESTDGKSEVIATTENHPFFVEGLGWTRVDDLVPGDLVPSATNGLLTVSALEWTDRTESVYNFGVDEFHTYFVGEVGAWVHNNCGKLSKFIVDKMKAAGFDPHEIKKEVISKNAKVSRYLFVEESGDIVVKPKTGVGPGEPTGLNVKMFED